MNYCKEGAELTLYIKSSLNSSGVRGCASADGGERGWDECVAEGGRGKNKVTQHFYLFPLKLALLPLQSHKAVKLTSDLFCPCPGSCPNCRMPPINFLFVALHPFAVNVMRLQQRKLLTPANARFLNNKLKADRKRQREDACLPNNSIQKVQFIMYLYMCVFAHHNRPK